ncbi:hypothetical protein [Mycolicibacterium sp. HK-90]|uniref:hypothetical protein n=1 Tax=Mycolicibacterium sp. HK-90 TaxID=3056937 RepID=UPI002659D713|nr:hypothetical protein [Mycolicibacterium sp. HK-90]WKG03884.1 hypothetical protein QU592_01715 [Mycolicibacterium sp. HK-90]
MMKKFATAAAAAGALSFAALDLGAGQANADDNWWIPAPPPPGVVGDGVNVPPGPISHLPYVPPPGHWDKPGKWVH